MNSLERRRIVRDRVIDVAVAKAAINQSRRQRTDAAQKLRKAMAASRFDAIKADSLFYSQTG